jgi:hypothetical protein
MSACLINATGFIECQANATNLIIELACIGEGSLFSEHFDNSQALIEIVFATPAILKAKTFLIGKLTALLGKQRIESRRP